MPAGPPGPLPFADADAQHPPRVMVVAELGVNHDGQPRRAAELVRAAAEAGADAVKLQLFDPERLLSAEAVLAAYQRESADDPRQMLRELTLSVEAVGELGREARSCGLWFIVTPFSREDAAALERLAVDAVKIASPDAVNTPLIEAVTALRRPVVISTGASTLEELEPAAALLRGHAPGGALLQCVSAYPTPFDAACLSGIRVLREAFGLPVGYSDHTPDPDTGALAVAAGAVVLEKHLTHDRAARGPDHAASLDPPGFADYVRRVRAAATAMGPRRKRVLPIEHDVRTTSRQSLCATRDLPSGHVLGREDLTIKRPGTGLPAAQLDAVLGSELARPIEADTLVRDEHLQA